MAVRNVISTLTSDGTEVMGPGVLMYHYPGNDIMNGSLLTVESNHFCVLKSRGAILNVYETGQYPVETPQRPLVGSFQQAFYGGQSPWQYEALFVARAKSVAKAQGMALSRELAELVYDVDYYVHVETKEDAVKLVTHRGVGLDELMQFDWALVGESDALAAELADVAELDGVDAAAVEGRLKKIREVMGERRRYLEIQA
jgi:SPFH domain-Band 7 family